MADGNGVDLGSIYGLLKEVSKTVSRHDSMLLSLQDEMNRLRGEVTGLRTETRSDIAALRQTVTQYHASVLGHGILISGLEDRVRRIETHLDLPSHISG